MIQSGSIPPLRINPLKGDQHKQNLNLQAKRQTIKTENEQNQSRKRTPESGTAQNTKLEERIHT
jgi:hypothetical protein